MTILHNDDPAATAAAIVILAGYFVPTLIAAVRRHQSSSAIFVVNLIFGWTVLGWLIALIWSMSATNVALMHELRRIRAAKPTEQSVVPERSREIAGLAERIEAIFADSPMLILLAAGALAVLFIYGLVLLARL
jgi:hypothetical protein